MITRKLILSVFFLIITVIGCDNDRQNRVEIKKEPVRSTPIIIEPEASEPIIIDVGCRFYRPETDNICGLSKNDNSPFCVEHQDLMRKIETSLHEESKPLETCEWSTDGGCNFLQDGDGPFCLQHQQRMKELESLFKDKGGSHKTCGWTTDGGCDKPVRGTDFYCSYHKWRLKSRF